MNIVAHLDRLQIIVIASILLTLIFVSLYWIQDPCYRSSQSIFYQNIFALLMFLGLGAWFVSSLILLIKKKKWWVLPLLALAVMLFLFGIYSSTTGLLCQSTQGLIDVVDVTCNPNVSYSIVVMNSDKYAQVSTSNIKIIIDDSNVSVSWNPVEVPNNGGLTTGTISCSGTGQPICDPGSVHEIKIIGPSGRSIRNPVSC